MRLGLLKTPDQIKGRRGFTIVELLIVIIVIGILAAITILAFNGVTDQARMSKMTTDLKNLTKAARAARISTSKTLMDVTGSGNTAGGCTAHTAGTDLATLPLTDACWKRYANALDAISEASGINVRSLVDPWGRPYFIGENEGEGGGCAKDGLAAYAYPFSGGAQYSGTHVSLPLSGFSGCTT